MLLKDIRAKARQMGIDPANKGKVELIQSIQIREGNAPCFGKSVGHCPFYRDCCWASDCLGIIGVIQSRHTFLVM